MTHELFPKVWAFTAGKKASNNLRPWQIGKYKNF